MKPLRHEDPRLVTGQGKFTADWDLPGQLYAVMVRSQMAHATLTSIDTADARALDGVVAIFTAEDVQKAAYRPIPSGPDIAGIDGEKIRKGKMPVLADSVVRFVGQPIAFVVAETLAAARDAAELVDVDYDELPVAASPEFALAPGAASLHENAPGNVALNYESGDKSAVENAFANAAKTSRLKIESQRLAGAPIEPKACMASHDKASGVTTVYTPTQGVNGMRASLSEVTRIEVPKLNIVAQDVGGSFGLRGGAGPETALVVLASQSLGRPVKWVSQRSELFIGEWHGRALTLDGELALDADNNILAIRFTDQADLGAYNCYFGGFIGTGNLSATMGGVYQVPALYMCSTLVFTNRVPVSAYRGAGRPDIAFAIERLVDHTAAEHGIDPLELRRKNFIPQEAFPYTTANGTVYDCGNFSGVIDKALGLSSYQSFDQRQKESQSRGRLRGIGLGFYLEKSGAGGAPKDEVGARFDASGKLTLHGVTGPSGQGHETSFAQIVADGLGVDWQQIAYQAGDAAQGLVGNGTGGSRSLYGAGSAFKNLAKRLIAHGQTFAATALDVDPDSLDYRDGQYQSANGKSITLFDLAQRLGNQSGDAKHPLDCQADTVTGANFPNGCHIAEVEIDPQTGVCKVLNYTSVDDLGNVVSPKLVEGQVHGGVIQGAGQAFLEQVVYDESGQLLSGSFVDYAMPRAGLIPKLHSDTFPVPTELNELGAKGVGESGCSGSLPALANAVMDALRLGNAGPMDMPYTPARVWQELQEADAG